MDIRWNLHIKQIMKLVVLLTLVGLSSCGGSDSADGSGSYSVGGTITGLQGSVTLRNNGTDGLTLNTSGEFIFSTRLSDGASYNVDLQAQPAGQICTIDNGSGVIAGANVTNVLITCDGVTLSGSYQSVPFIQVDSDINDPFATANVSNDTSLLAQSISTFATVNGFATAFGTGGVLEGDRFATTADESDFYRVSLQKNQTVRLQVVDFAGVDVFQGDLDLYLYDTGLTPIAVSKTITEFESITVPNDGDYFIEVYAFEGTSKYTLNLDNVSPVNLPQQSSVDFIPGESIIKFKSGSAVMNSKARTFVTNNLPMSLRHTQAKRANLARFDVNGSAANKAKSSTKFLDYLKQKNFSS